MKYKVNFVCGWWEEEPIFDTLTDAKVDFIKKLTHQMIVGDEFSLALFTGIVDRDGFFWPHRCIATFDYDGDSSV